MFLSCPVHDAAMRFGDKPAILYQGKSLSFAALESCTCNAARALLKLGITDGDVVAILSHNSLAYVVQILAINRIGASALLLNIRWSAPDWRKALDETGCRLLFAETEFAETLGELPIKTMQLDERRLFQRSGDKIGEDRSLPEQVNADTASTIIYTSGSSGKPKGVVLTYRNHYYNALGSNVNIPLEPSDCWLISLPLYHVGGLSILYRSLLAGSQMLLADSFDSSEIVTLIKNHRVTHLSLVPTMLHNLISAANSNALPTSIKTILLGGAAVSKELAAEIRRLRLPVVTTYGLTETASQVMATSVTDSLDKLHTSGKVLKYRELKVVDRAGKELAPGETGEITVGGKVVFKGYLSDSSCVAGGWFRTGDIGCLDDDGYLTVVGRQDEMIISGGENIDPNEIVAAAESYSQVTAAAVIVVAHPYWGQRPVLVVQQESGAEIDTTDLHNFLVERLGKLKAPDKIRVVDQLPHTAIGKIDKATIKKLFNDNRH